MSEEYIIKIKILNKEDAIRISKEIRDEYGYYVLDISIQVNNTIDI